MSESMLRMETGGQVAERFRTFDQNGDGLIAQEELAILLHQLDRRWDETRSSRLFRVMDLNRNGFIDYDEFVYWVFSGPGAVHTNDLDAFRHDVALSPPKIDTKADMRTTVPDQVLSVSGCAYNRSTHIDETLQSTETVMEADRAVEERGSVPHEPDAITASAAIADTDTYFAYALSELKSLDVVDVNLLYRCDQPYPCVAKVVEALKVLLGEVVNTGPDAPWNDVKLVLRDSRIVERLLTVNKDKIEPETLSALVKYISSYICPTSIVRNGGPHSRVAKCFSMMIFAMCAYACQDGDVAKKLHMRLHLRRKPVLCVYTSGSHFNIENAEAPSGEIIEWIRPKLAKQLLVPAVILELSFAPPPGQRLVHGHEFQPVAACFEPLPDKSQAELDAVTPTLEEALTEIKAIQNRHISEIKCNTHEYEVLQATLEATYLVLNGSHRDWQKCSQHILMDHRKLIEDLQTFATEDIPEKTIAELERRYVYTPAFTPEEVGKIGGKAARALCMWVLARYAHAKSLEPAVLVTVQSTRKDAGGGFRVTCVNLPGEEIASLDVEDTSMSVITDLRKAVSQSLNLKRGVRLQFLFPDGKAIGIADEALPFSELFQA